MFVSSKAAGYLNVASDIFWQALELFMLSSIYIFKAFCEMTDKDTSLSYSYHTCMYKYGKNRKNMGGHFRSCVEYHQYKKAFKKCIGYVVSDFQNRVKMTVKGKSAVFLWFF